MKREELWNEYPQMPDKIKERVSAEIEKQIRQQNGKRVVRLGKRIALTAAVAVLCFGTTVAAAQIYKLHTEKTGTYGVATTVKTDENMQTEVQEAEQTQAPVDIPKVCINLNYLPKDLTLKSEAMDSCSNEATPWQGGISIFLIRMDQGDEAFRVLDKNVLESEEIQAGLHSGVYLKLQTGNTDRVDMNQKIYLLFPEVHYVAEIYIGEDVTKEEALKVAEGMQLTEVEAYESDEAVPKTFDWSTYCDIGEEEEEDDDDETYGTLCVAKSEVSIYMPGEAFDLTGNTADGQTAGLQATVKEVQVLEKADGLEKSYFSDEALEMIDDDGNLLQNIRSYIKEENGIDSIDEVVDTREMPQCLVVVTTEYKNTTDTDFENILFNQCVTTFDEADDQYVISQETPSEGDEWDNYQDSAEAARAGGEMIYYDVHGGEGQNGSNYIPSLKAGEAITIHTAFLVSEEDLGHLYLSADARGAVQVFDEWTKESGFVNISR